MNTKTPKEFLKRELEAIAKKRGGLTPKSVLEAAKHKSSPLHDYFEWDDTEAARMFRERQAAQLIRSVSVVIESNPGKTVKVRAFVNVREEEDDGTINLSELGKYVPIETALKVDSYREQMLENARRELSSFRQKYSSLQELSGVFSEIDKLKIKAA